MVSKTKKQAVSMFGINDCHKPKKILKKVTHTEFVRYISVQKL